MSLLIGAAVAIAVMAGPIEPPPSDHPEPVQPQPGSISVVEGPATVVPTADRSSVTGPATWYGTGPGKGHAAAGPALRKFLGAHWRGQTVTVTFKGKHVRVVVDDWCACGHGRVIDLSDEDFASLAPLSSGVIRVSVS